MNQNQQYILYAVIAVVAAMLLYPPFVGHARLAVIPMGYGWVFSPPETEYLRGMVNIPMLLVQWAGVLVIGGISFFLAKKS